MTHEDLYDHLVEQDFTKKNDKSKRAFKVIYFPTKEEAEELKLKENDISANSFSNYMYQEKGIAFSKFHKAYILKEVEYIRPKLSMAELQAQFLEKNEAKKINSKSDIEKEYSDKSLNAQEGGYKTNKMLNALYNGLEMLNKEETEIIKYKFQDRMAIVDNETLLNTNKYQTIYTEIRTDIETEDVEETEGVEESEIALKIENNELIPIKKAKNKKISQKFQSR